MNSPSSSSSDVTISSYFDREGLRHVVPYTHVYSTSAKGRWIGMTLLEAFSREFAVVGDEVDCDDGDGTCNGQSNGAASASLPSVCTDFRANTLTYAKKMAKGSLFIVGREEECVRAGEVSVPIVKEMLLARADTIPPHADEALPDTQQRDAWFKELNAKLPLVAVPQKRGGGGGGGSPSTAPASTLRQLDAIRHVVTRREHHINLGDDNQCIEIVAMARERARGQLESRRTSEGSSPPIALTSANDDCGDQPDMREGPPYYLAINKPSSVAIHPGGRFHTNTLLRLVEDTFSGAKASSTPINTSGRLYAVVDGFPALGDGLSGCRSTFVCEPVLESESIKQKQFTVSLADAEGVALTHVHGRWRPLIRVPHEKVPLEDRKWLLSLLPTHSVVRIKEEAGVGTPVIEGVKEGCVQCPLVLAESFIHTTPPAATVAADGDANGNSTSVVHVGKGAACSPPLKLFIVHRLDRCTSGIIVFALDTASAKLITDSFADIGAGSRQTPSSGQVVSPTDLGSNKKYLARVHGDVRPLFSRADEEGRPPLGFSTVQILAQASTASTLSPIIINSATYCTSFQGATYWCLDAQEEELFESMMVREGGESFAASASDKVIGEKRSRGSAGGDGLEPDEESNRATTVSCIVPGKGKVAFASVEEKRDAMRQLVASKRRIEVEVDRSGEASALVVEGVISVPTPSVSLTSSPEAIRQYFNTRYDCLKHARTHVAFVGYDGATDQSVVLCSPLTGRTHQIRIHMASHGFPIVGDTKYFTKGRAAASLSSAAEQVDAAAPDQLGEEDSDRICLHALEYTIPELQGSSQKVCTDAPVWCQMPKAVESMGL